MQFDNKILSALTIHGCQKKSGKGFFWPTVYHHLLIRHHTAPNLGNGAHPVIRIRIRGEVRQTLRLGLGRIQAVWKVLRGLDLQGLPVLLSLAMD